jgi:hypothetical protein
MSHLFAAVLLLASPGCPHEETTCLTPTEYVEVHLSTRIPGWLEEKRSDEFDVPGKAARYVHASFCGEAYRA